MRVLASGLLCGCLLMSGCTRQQVNSVSVFDYEKADEAGDVALKTMGNLVPWVGGAVLYAMGAFAYIVSGGGKERVSGTVSGGGSVSTYK
jgi:hypothetical protein